MLWNVDFEVWSAMFQLIFLVFYLTKRHLPTRQNQFYVAAVVFSFLAAAFDVLTAVANSYSASLPLPFLEGFNLVYFLVVPALSFCFFMYIVLLTGQHEFVYTPVFFVFCIPAVVSFLLALISPVTDFLYYFDENLVYTHGSCYGLEILTNAFYILLTVFFVASFRKNTNKTQRFAIYFFCLTLALGAALQGLFFHWILLTNAVTSMALVVVYLSLQNPDMYIDKTSSLFNFDAFRELVREYLLDGRIFSCIVIGISDYNNLDVLYGTANAEAAILDVAAYMRKAFGRKRLFRLDSSRFLILEMGKGNFDEIEKAVRLRFESPFAGVTGEVHLKCSVIIVPYWHLPSDVEQLNNLFAFVARNEADESNATIEVDGAIIDRMEHERAVERAIDHAVMNNTIQMYFQPIYDTEAKRITTCEALARLFDDEIGFIPPDEFIAKAEENGSIVKLGAQIYEKVCVFLAEQNPSNFGLQTVHVNLSPAQCKQDRLDADLIAVADKYDIPHRMLDLELTESAAVDENKTIRRNMEALISAGFTFSLDDYGTGYSNMSTIAKLPFKSIKLDKSLIWTYYEGRFQMLPDMMSMFHDQELEIIAEGVETAEMSDGLIKLKCNFLQGYYYSKPLPQKEFISYLRDFNKS